MDCIHFGWTVNYICWSENVVDVIVVVAGLPIPLSVSCDRFFVLLINRAFHEQWTMKRDRDCKFQFSSFGNWILKIWIRNISNGEWWRHCICYEANKFLNLFCSVFGSWEVFNLFSLPTLYGFVLVIAFICKMKSTENWELLRDRYYSFNLNK